MKILHCKSVRTVALKQPAALKELRCSSYLSAFFITNYAKNAGSELSAILMAGVSFIKEWRETHITDRQFRNTGHVKLRNYPPCNATLNEVCYLNMPYYIKRYQEMQLSMLSILRKS
jgi:hypothetical protein